MSQGRTGEIEKGIRDGAVDAPMRPGLQARPSGGRLGEHDSDTDVQMEVTRRQRRLRVCCSADDVS